MKLLFHMSVFTLSFCETIFRIWRRRRFSFYVCDVSGFDQGPCYGFDLGPTVLCVWEIIFVEPKSGPCDSVELIWSYSETLFGCVMENSLDGFARCLTAPSLWLSQARRNPVVG